MPLREGTPATKMNGARGIRIVTRIDIFQAEGRTHLRQKEMTKS